MSKSISKIRKEIALQDKIEKAKQPYAPPLRPRSTVFRTGKEYNRQKSKQETRRIADNW